MVVISPVRRSARCIVSEAASLGRPASQIAGGLAPDVFFDRADRPRPSAPVLLASFANCIRLSFQPLACSSFSLWRKSESQLLYFHSYAHSFVKTPGVPPRIHVASLTVNFLYYFPAFQHTGPDDRGEATVLPRDNKVGNRGSSGKWLRMIFLSWARL